MRVGDLVKPTQALKGVTQNHKTLIDSLAMVDIGIIIEIKKSELPLCRTRYRVYFDSRKVWWVFEDEIKVVK